MCTERYIEINPKIIMGKLIIEGTRITKTKFKCDYGLQKKN
jgi:uncharacterized protein (DUF433 family)